MLAERPQGGLLRVDSVRVGADRILVVHGELDLSTSGRFRALLEASGNGSGRILLDLSTVTFMDATGLRVIAEPPEALEGRLVLARLSPAIRRLFDLTAAERSLPYASRPSHRGFEDRNVAYVRRLNDVFRRDGAAAMLEYVPDSVVWQPLQAGRPVLCGSRALREFCAVEPVRSTIASVPSSYTPVDDNVLVRSSLHDADGRVTPIWSLWEFAGDRLTKATTFPGDIAA